MFFVFLVGSDSGGKKRKHKKQKKKNKGGSGGKGGHSGAFALAKAGSDGLQVSWAAFQLLEMLGLLVPSRPGVRSPGARPGARATGSSKLGAEGVYQPFFVGPPNANPGLSGTLGFEMKGVPCSGNPSHRFGFGWEGSPTKIDRNKLVPLC